MSKKEEYSQMETFERFIENLKIGDFPGFYENQNRSGTEQENLIYIDDIYDPESHDSTKEEKYSSWIDSFDSIDFPDWDSESSSGFETLAWYEDISRYGAQARIAITDRGIGIYASIIRKKFVAKKLQTPDLNRKSIVAAIEVLLVHELFHHKVEWFALKLTNTFFLPNSNHYVTYHHKVYEPLRNPISDDLLEEALATAAMILEFPQSSELHGLDKPEIKIVKAAIEEHIPNKPKGYRKAINFLTPSKFKEGKMNLGATILHTSISTVSPTKELPLISIGKSKWESYFRMNWQLELVTTSALSSSYPPPFAISLPANKVKKYLADEGYSDSGLGKGSHQVWKAQNRPAITLPQRKDYEGHQEMKNVVRALGLKNLRELEEKLKSY